LLDGLRRRRTHQTTPPITTATARIPKAIQPQGVSLLVSSALFDATAAPAAAAAPGLTPVVVVCTVVVDTCGTGAATVVGAVVVVTTVAVRTCVVVTVVGGVVTVTGAVVIADAVVVATVVVAVLVVRLASDVIAVETAARFEPLPHDVTATATASPAIAATRYLTPRR